MNERDTLRLADEEIARSERWLEVAYIARRYHVTHRTVERWCVAGKLTAVRTPGGHWRIRDDSSRHDKGDKRASVAV